MLAGLIVYIVAKADLTFVMLPKVPECWDSRYVPSHKVEQYF